MIKPGFEQVKRGYDPEQVDRTVTELNRDLVLTKNEVDDLRNQLTEAKRTIERLEDDLEQAGKPTYAGLGARFEHALRLGEEKAEQLVFEANEQANNIIVTARQEAERIRELQHRATQEKMDQAETKISFLMNEAEYTAQKILKAAEVKAESTVNEALDEATAIRGAAATEAVQLRSSTKREIEKLRSHAQLEIDELRTVALKELHEQTAANPDSQVKIDQEILKQDLEMELSARRFEAEKEYLKKHQEAVESTQSYLDEANTLLAEVVRRLNDKRLEADVLEAKIASEIKEQAIDASQEAERVLSQAHIRAEEILAEARKQSLELIQDSKIGLKHLQEEQKSIMMYFEALENLLVKARTVQDHQSEFSDDE